MITRADLLDPGKPDTIYALQGVTVEFTKNVIEQRSLKGTLSRLLMPVSSSKYRALDNINLEIRSGEHVGLIGRNGAGKSTLLRVLTGIIQPQRGSVAIAPGLHIVPLLELGIGFHPDLSGRENCYLAGSLMGYAQSEITARIGKIITFSELEEFIDEPVKNYSSGMYARLAFAIATDIEPEVLIVDEVFGVGDEFFMRKCVVRIQRLMKRGITTIFVSHNLDFLVTQCNRLIWLDRGAVVLDGNPGEVAAAYRGAAGTRE
jgi:ABC-type polysaccharide/polyol phosphate transport system ATPase subunit